ncbi:MAG: 4-(cytidine 5'-diphospho)-2-C-methyl-D-erythritol kinase [Elusimicrobiota bacterium]
MPLSVQVQCPAKVNLFLEVTGRRRDGYHNLATLFAKINLFDVLDVEAAPSGFELEIADETGQRLAAGPDNLVLVAARAFRKAFRLGMGARFLLTKRIPVGAGLGGGSSDAAGTLIALARLYRMELDRSRTAVVRRIAREIGADVPVFLRREAVCEGRGIGERLAPVTPAKALPWMLLVFPGVSVSTGDVYGRLKGRTRKSVLTRLTHLDTLKKKLEKGRPVPEWGGLLFNRLEEAVLDYHPEVEQAKTILKRLGLAGVLMTGSGAAVYGFVRSRTEGERVLKLVQGYPWKIILTCCLG